MKYTHAEEAFFRLIRLAVGSSRDANVSLDRKGWAAVLEMARKQALVAVVLDGVECLPSVQKPPSDILMEWIGLVQRVEVQNRRLNQAAVKVCDKFASEGMPVVLLKGQGLSTLYPRPLHRMSGDLDLWVDAPRNRVVAYARKYCPGVEVVYHHVDFPVKNDVPIELHFTPTWLNNWWLNRRLQRALADWKAQSLSNKVELPGGVGEVAVPVLGMNRVYLLLHAYRHLFDEGIGLRQLLDYYFLLSQPCTDIERDEAVRMLSRFHLLRFAGAMMYVLREVFGLEEEKMLVAPAYQRGRRLLHEVMMAGNFGQHDERIHRVAGESLFHRFCRKLRRNFGFFSDYPGEVAWSPLFKVWHYTWRRCHGYLPQGE